MKKTGYLALGLGLGLAVLAFAPAAVHADEFGVGLNVNLGADDAAHFDFGPGARHEPWVFKAAQNLDGAKHVLWNSPDHGSQRMHAIQRINQALDDLRWIENHPHQDRHEALRQALGYARWSRKALAHSHRGEGKRDALGYLDQAINILNRLAHRPRH